MNPMFNIQYGLYIVTTCMNGRDNGCISNTVAQVTAQPNQISVALNKSNYTTELIQKSGKFTASILSEDADFELFKHFGFQSGRTVDKFKNFSDCLRVANGTMAITRGTNAFISAKVKQSIDLGTHFLFIGEVTEMEIFSDIPSATYNYYQSHIKPKPEAVGTTSDGKTIWRCKVCGYEYANILLLTLKKWWLRLMFLQVISMLVRRQKRTCKKPLQGSLWLVINTPIMLPLQRKMDMSRLPLSS